jgi:hypothetical protein
VILPKGARTIQISEKALSRNYLAVRDIYGKYFLNGNWHLSSDGTYTIGGAKFLYKRSYIEPEVLRPDGPLLKAFSEIWIVRAPFGKITIGKYAIKNKNVGFIMIIS